VVERINQILPFRVCNIYANNLTKNTLNLDKKVYGLGGSKGGSSNQGPIMRAALGSFKLFECLEHGSGYHVDESRDLYVGEGAVNAGWDSALVNDTAISLGLFGARQIIGRKELPLKRGFFSHDCQHESDELCYAGDATEEGGKRRRL
jgi:hypothetical protein